MTERVFSVPDLGEGLTEAELVGWLVSVGETIAVDQPVAEVETAKSVVEVPSPFGGIVRTLHGEAGESLLVGAPLVTVADAGAAESSGTGSGNVLVGYGTRDTAHTGRSRTRRPAASASGGVAALGNPGGRVASASERIETPDLDTAARGLLDHPNGPAAANPGGDRGHGPIAVISPVVRRLAKTRGLDLATVHASGLNGVITRQDVEAASASASEVDATTGLGVRESAPLSPFRRSVAASMARSRSEIPEATVWVDVDATELAELRRRIRFEARHPSFSALIGRFVVTALRRYPVLAGRLSPDASTLTLFDGINLGFAADTERGLVVPVVRNADALTLRELDIELARLTAAARDGSSASSELRGSTFTVNNYGTLGVDGSAAIINHPEVAILGLGRMLERAWVVDGTILPRTIMQLSLVFDHRVCDGGVAAGFLRMIADAIEHPYDAFGDL